MIAKRFLLLTVLIVGFLALVFFFHDRDPSIDVDTASKLSLPMPEVTEAEISEDELHDIVETLVRTNSWFNSLPFARIEYQVTVTKSDLRYDRDIAEMKASFPSTRIDEATAPTLSRVWEIVRSVEFDQTRLACVSRSNALGRESQTWDGDVFTGYVDYGTTQEPNYYLKSEVDVSLSWLPQVGSPAIWFCNQTPYDSRLDWVKAPPTLAGATHFADHDCIVLRDFSNHWIVGREDRKLYGRYSQRDWEQFDQHREVAEGIFWPMASIRKRFGKEGLEWTDEATVTLLKSSKEPDDSVFRVEIEPGVKVCDLRNVYPVVFMSDPNRTEEELAEIYANAKNEYDRDAPDDRRSQELVGKDAPELGEGTWLNSEPLSIGELRGKRSVLLGFGHTACAPCGNMLAMFAKRQETSPDQFILVFAASDSISAVEKKLSLFKIACRTFIPSDESGFGAVFERYRVNAYPTVVAIDAQGIIASHQIGMLSNLD